MEAQVFERLRAICADVFLIPREKIDATSSPETVDAWDSLQHLNLVLAIEQEFNVSFEPEDIEGMKSVGAISDLLQRKVHGR